MTDMQEIRLAKLEPHPHNVRRQLHDLEELAASMRAKGIVQALTVVPHPTARTKYVVLGGHRRLAAAKLAMLKAAPCMIREDLATPEAQTEFMIVENTQRNDLAPMEEARAYQQLLDLPGYNAKRIAENTGRKQRLVQDRIKLSKVSDPIAAKLDHGQITLEQALVFAEFADDEKATKQLLEVTGSPWEWKHRVQSLTQSRKFAAQAARTKKELAAAGADLMPAPDGWPWRGEYALANEIPTEGPELTVDEHVTAEHKAVMGHNGVVQWAVLRSELPGADAPRELTPDEIAEAEQEQRIRAGLEVADHVRSTYLEELLTAPPADLALTLYRPRVVGTFLQRSRALPLIGLAEGARRSDVEAALAKLTLEQLAVADKLAEVYGDQYLLQPSGWGEGEYGNDFMMRERDLLSEVFGYVWSDIEKEAMEVLRLKREQRETRRAEERKADASADAGQDDAVEVVDHDAV